MKEGFDKEIDSLLRRRARWPAAESFADGGGNGAATPASAHLDADELGAFAEGALPAGARLAAVTHIADCDRCRGVVVSLSRALGGIESEPHALVTAVPASADAARSASWRAWMGALFSPRSLRYAVPLLAVSLVAVVSFVALRSRNAGSAPNTQSARPRVEVAQTRPDASSAGTEMTANANQSGVLERQPGETADEAAPPVTTRTAPSAGRGPNAGESQPAPVGSVAEDAAPPPPPPAAPPATSAGPEAPAEIAKSAPKPVTVEASQPPAKSDGEDSNKEKRARASEPVDEIAANEAAMQRRRAANDVQMPDGGTRNQKRSADNSASKTYGEGNTAGATQREAERDDRGAGGSLAARRRPAARAEQKTEEEETTRVGETRTAAGHRFRREGSAWVDVNYKRSMRSTGVRRGTEAFRALVADVPVVGRVAEQIAGEVVVVVGGRAYHIH
ncbi:MAG: hypothetical protein ABW250_15685 [Pyrinomonadaceae bacterium]